MLFQPPGLGASRAAIGETGCLSETMRRVFKPDADFEQLPTPGAHDWLAAHRESGETFDRFKASRPNKPDGAWQRIYLQPLGEFLASRSPSLERLKEYAEIFFAIETDP